MAGFISIFNPFSAHRSKQSILSITIHEDRLIITQTSNIDHPTTINLEPRTIYHGLLFKPSIFITQLTSYISSIKPSRPTTNVQLPPSIDQTSPLLPFLVLQYTLALAKTGVHLVYIGYAKNQHHEINLLELLYQPNSRSPKFWLSLILAASCMLGIGITLKQRELGNMITSLTNQAAELKTTNTDHEKQFNETNRLKSDIKLLQAKDLAIQNVLGKMHNPNTIIRTIAHQTPATLWLKSITIGNANKKQHASPSNQRTGKQLIDKKTKPHHITINGTSSTGTSITRLLKNLNQCNTGINLPILASVSKEKRCKKNQTPKTNQALYHFVIEGQS